MTQLLIPQNPKTLIINTIKVRYKINIKGCIPVQAIIIFLRCDEAPHIKKRIKHNQERTNDQKFILFPINASQLVNSLRIL